MRSVRKEGPLKKYEGGGKIVKGQGHKISGTKEVNKNVHKIQNFQI